MPVLLTLATPVGCGTDHGLEFSTLQPESAPSFEMFLAAAEVLPDGRLIADQDILFSDIDAVRAYFDREMEHSRRMLRNTAPGGQSTSAPLTVATLDEEDTFWGFPLRMHLTFCVDEGSFGTDADELLAAIDAAAASWHQRVGVFFERVGGVASCNGDQDAVVFNVRSANVSGTAAAFLPFNARSDRELLVDDTAFTTTAGGRDLEGILRHELGHVLGFRHEHIWLTPKCTGEKVTIEVNEGTLGGRLLTDYDVDSVMHYPQCRPSGTGGYRQTELDYQGAINLYGLAPMLIIAVL
jgi:hypothetical protein